MGYEFEVLSGRILEAATEVHRTLGPGFLESIYENSVVLALLSRGIAVMQQHEVHISFAGRPVGLHPLDLLVDGEIIVEINAIKALEDIHFAQLRSYLRATNLHVGLLLNFNAPVLIAKRVVL